MSDSKAPASRWLKSTQWLADNLSKVVVVDASYFLPTEKRDARAEYLAGHLPGAVFFDIDTVADTSIDLPHMLPGPEQFGAAMGKLGISEKDSIVVYDRYPDGGIYSAPRVWWSLRIFGAKDVSILDALSAKAGNDGLSTPQARAVSSLTAGVSTPSRRRVRTVRRSIRRRT